MKAALTTAYGGPEVIKMATIAIPSPRANEVLVKVCTSTVNSGDARMRRADPSAVRLVLGLMRPRKPVMGAIFSGVVEAVGAQVTRFKAGDAVTGATLIAGGCHAEYVCVAEKGIITHKHPDLSHEDAAAIVFGGTAALHFLRKANVQPGQKVLIVGASGAMGVAAVQLAKYFGAEVTGMCSAANDALVRSIGAVHIIDYTRDGLPMSGAFDVVFDTVGKADFSDLLAATRPKGTLLLGSALMAGMLRGTWANLTSGKKVVSGVAIEKVEEIDYLQNLCANGQCSAVIERVYAFDDIAEAHRHVDTGRKRGNVVIKIGA